MAVVQPVKLPVEPLAPEDGTCVQCGKLKPTPKHIAGRDVKHRTSQRLRDVAMVAQEAARDPFCSSVCARIYYGTTQNSPQNSWVDPGAAAPGRKANSCKGCGCPRDTYTQDCRTCWDRRYQRERKSAPSAP